MAVRVGAPGRRPEAARPASGCPASSRRPSSNAAAARSARPPGRPGRRDAGRRRARRAGAAEDRARATSPTRWSTRARPSSSSGWPTMCSAMVIRAFSWHAILRAALPAAHIRLADAMQGTMIGVLMSSTLPARLGEPSRALVVARRTGRPRENLPIVLGTVVSQTLLNIVALAILGGGHVLLGRPLQRPPGGPADHRDRADRAAGAGDRRAARCYVAAPRSSSSRVAERDHAAAGRADPRARRAGGVPPAAARGARDVRPARRLGAAVVLLLHRC